ncbi:MAG: hypothetical protein PHV59_13135 [Victivallales bacterium]|nr:hypothetical protein [Victivallales bacterium]
MIPSDHFVRFYNEVFKFLDEKNALPEYYREISHHQELHCLEIFTKNGLKGMYEYWEHIRLEENCDSEQHLEDGCLQGGQNVCPSLSKILDSDATPCRKYCLHCPGWVLPLLGKCGYYAVYNVIALDKPQCRMYTFEKKGQAVELYRKLLQEGYDPELLFHNLD